MTLRSEAEALAALVEAETGLRTSAFVSQRFNPPGAMVLPDSPYVESGTTFGTVRINWELLIAVQNQVIETAISELDRAIEDSLVAVINGHYGVSDVSEPLEVTFNGQKYLGVRISVNKQINL